MIRIFFTYILPLIAPTLLYFAWRSWRKKYSRNSDKNLACSEKSILFWCFIIGIILMGTTLVSIAFTSGVHPTKTDYISPHLENGKIIGPTFKKMQ